MLIPSGLCVQEPNPWIGFWGSYIGAVASFFMAFIAYRSLQNNNDQLDYMKAQNRPYVYPTIRIIRDDGYIYYYLLTENYGNDLAYDVKICLNVNSEEECLLNTLKDYVSFINKSTFSLASKSSKYQLIYKIPCGKNLEGYTKDQRDEFFKVYDSLEKAKYSIVLSYTWLYGNIDSKEFILDGKDATIESTKITQVLGRINTNISKFVEFSTSNDNKV